MQMKEKWKIYFITLVSYAVVHSIRTIWASIKSNLTIAPFNYQVWFLGTIDMMVLFLVGFCMYVFGHRVSSFGVKRVLVIVLALLFVFTNLVGIFLYLKFTQIALYIIFYGFGIGVSSSLSWPACLYMVSFYFNQKDRIYLSLWNASVQIGQFIALITYFAISTNNGLPTQASFFIEAVYILIILLSVIFFIPKNMESVSQTAPQRPPHQNMIEDQQIKEEYAQIQQQNAGQNMVDQERVRQSNDGDRQASNNMQREDKASKVVDQVVEVKGVVRQVMKSEIKSEQLTGSQSQVSDKSLQNNNGDKMGVKRVTIFTVWLLPGVALNTIALGFTKSVNAIIVSWMVYYLISLGLGAEAVIITILWSIGIILGGLICGFLNKNLSYLFFACELLGAALCFIILQEFHKSIFETQIFFSVIVCSLFYGGPFNMLNTAVPILLANQRQVQQYQNGKAAVISLTQSFSLICCGLSLIIVPSLGISNMHIVCSLYCFVACFLLLGQNYRKSKAQKMNALRQRLKCKPKKSIEKQ